MIQKYVEHLKQKIYRKESVVNGLHDPWDPVRSKGAPQKSCWNIDINLVLPTTSGLFTTARL